MSVDDKLKHPKKIVIVREAYFQKFAPQNYSSGEKTIQ